MELAGLFRRVRFPCKFYPQREQWWPQSPAYLPYSQTLANNQRHPDDEAADLIPAKSPARSGEHLDIPDLRLFDFFNLCSAVIRW